MADDEEHQHVGDLIPRPDPSLITARAIRTGLDDTKELLRAELHARGALTDAKIEAIDRATVLLQTIADRLPVMVDDKVSTLRALHTEKFDSIKTQFLERDTRTEQTSRDSKVAVDAALQAAKEAVAEQNRSSALSISKSEVATTKQIDQMGLLIQSNVAGINTSIGDLKDRLTRIEGNTSGHKESVTATMAIIGVSIALAGLVFGYGLFKGTAPAPSPVAVVVPSSIDQAQSAEIAALTRLLAERISPLPAK